MRTHQVLLQKKSFQGVPHVGNITWTNHTDLNVMKLKSADEGKRPISWLFSNSDFKINRSKVGTNYVVSLCSIVHF
jgi:hypothetical protein